MKRYIDFLFRLLVPLIGFFAFSCDKYLDIQPKGKVIPTLVEDYDLLLNAGVLGSTGDAQVALFTDDIDLPYVNLQSPSAEEKMYLWHPEFYGSDETNPKFWTRHYQNIYYYNTVLDGINEAEGDPELKKVTKAQALLGRSYEYFYLVNLYGKSYNPATASQDLAVPFVTSINIMEDVPAKSSVAELYKHIIADIEAALPDLPKQMGTNRYRGSVYSAQSILAKVYYYMDDLDRAVIYAKQALEDENSGLLDLNDYATVSDLPKMNRNTQHYFSRRCTNTSFLRSLSRDLIDVFEPGDIRASLFFKIPDDHSTIERDKIKSTKNDFDYYANFGTSVAEMKLIVAEHAAKSGDLESALHELNELRVKRFKPASYANLESTNQATVTGWVAAERRREFGMFGPTRWFDLRLMNKHKQAKVITRTNIDDEVIAELKQDGAGYTLDIPPRVEYFQGK